MLHAIDWQSFYAARADNFLGNKNSSVYTEAWSPDKSDDTRFQILISDIDNVVFGVDHDRTFMLFIVLRSQEVLASPINKVDVPFRHGIVSNCFHH